MKCPDCDSEMRIRGSKKYVYCRGCGMLWKIHKSKKHGVTITREYEKKGGG